MSILDIEFQNEAGADELVKASLARMRSNALERREACVVALPALDRLADMMTSGSGQCFKVREILFSLWNGKPAGVIEIVNLDWNVRKDLVAVLLAFGYEDSQAKCFYDALQAAVRRAGIWEWFIEESDNLEKCREYVKAQNARRKETPTVLTPHL